MMDYFTHLFSATDTSWEGVTSCLDSKITESQNSILLADVEEKEVKIALFHMHPDKSPGLYGMTHGFFQKCWNIVKDDIVGMVTQFFVTGMIDDQLKYCSHFKEAGNDGPASYLSLQYGLQDNI